MADNSTLPVNVGTEVFANDDIGPGVKYPRVKATWGPDGTANDTDIASGKSLPIQIRSATGVAIDSGSGTGGSFTPRVIIDSSQFAALGQATMANSQPVVIASNQSAVPVVNSTGEYETNAAGFADTPLGATGATGDYLSHVIVVPATTTPGNVIIKDNTVAVITFPGGAGSVSNLVPFIIPVGAYSVNGAWKLTCGSNVSAMGVGNFT